MLIHTVEYDAKNALLSLVEEINNQQAAAWGLVLIKREYLKNLQNNDLVLTIKPALQEVSRVKIFFMENRDIYISWFGMPRQTYQKIVAVCQNLLRDRETIGLEKIVSYLDPQVMGDELHMHLNSKGTKTSNNGNNMRLDAEQKNASPAPANTPGPDTLEFLTTTAQLERFQKQMERRPTRQQLTILIVEDQHFLRNLLSEVLRTAYNIDAAANAKDGWDLYLERAPDIIFLDIGLPDGSGHLLAQKIKELDPMAYVVMVTASNQRSDVETAKNNHVDGFIIKPFNKKKIADCIDSYAVSRKIPAKKRTMI